MKKLLAVCLIVFTLIGTPLLADNDPYPNWEWNGYEWIWVGTGEPLEPTPPPARE